MKTKPFELYCLPDDIVYVADTHLNCVVPIEIDEIVISRIGLGEIPNVTYKGAFYEDHVSNSPEYEFDEQVFKESVFHTWEEAEQALREEKDETNIV